MLRLLFIAVACLIGGSLPLVSMGQTLQQRIQRAYARFEQNPHLKHAVTSLTVLNANTGAVVFSKNEHIGLATASTLKTITSATAYEVLGADYTYQTELYYTGTIEQGILNGDMVIKGVGDPSLGSDRFEGTKEAVLLAQWVRAIKQAGIREIKGSIVGDDLLFGGQTAAPRWIWQDMGSYYGAGVSGLNWRENLVDVYLKPGKAVGAPTSLQVTIPNIAYLKLANESTTGPAGSGDQVYPYAAPYASIIYLRGTYGIDRQKPVQISLPDAGYDAAFRLHVALEDSGVVVKQPATTAKMLNLSGKQAPRVGKVIWVHSSPSLVDLVYWFNQKSINLYGEAFLKTIALRQGKDTETAAAAAYMTDFWVNKLGIPKGSMRIYDGSGLSPENRVTTLTMARILSFIKKEPWFDQYYKSIPVYNGMKMKSGTIGGVLGYAGYQKNKDADLVFSLLINNYEGSSTAMRQQMFTLLNALK